MHWIDPGCLPETRGAISAWLLNPKGDLDGVVLDGHTQVHFPPHLGDAVAKRFKIGDTVHVRGLKPRGVDMVAAVSLATTDGHTIDDLGPDGKDGSKGKAGKSAKDKAGKDKSGKDKKADGKPAFGETEGNVVMSLYGPKGELRGALLDNGVSLRVPPHAAQELAAYLTPGANVHAWGDGVKSRFGRTLDVSDFEAH